MTTERRSRSRERSGDRGSEGWTQYKMHENPTWGTTHVTWTDDRRTLLCSHLRGRDAVETSASPNEPASAHPQGAHLQLGFVENKPVLNFPRKCKGSVRTKTLSKEAGHSRGAWNNRAAAVGFGDNWGTLCGHTTWGKKHPTCTHMDGAPGSMAMRKGNHFF